jgi:hypothetical protein
VELDIAEHVLVAPATPLFRVYNNGRPTIASVAALALTPAKAGPV